MPFLESLNEFDLFLEGRENLVKDVQLIELISHALNVDIGELFFQSGKVLIGTLIKRNISDINFDNLLRFLMSFG